jgi:sulfite dehydrogenase (quinone) subunit SoeC
LLVLVLAFSAGTVVAPLLLGLAVAAHVAGLMVERWLFFAEARHAVMNYY